MIRVLGLILCAIGFIIAAVSNILRPSLDSLATVVGAALIGVGYFLDRFTPPDDKAPLITFEFDELTGDEIPHQFNEEHLAFASCFYVSNLGDSIADCDVSFPDGIGREWRTKRSISNGERIPLRIFPLPSSPRDYAFRFSCRTGRGPRTYKGVYNATTHSMKIKC